MHVIIFLPVCMSPTFNLGIQRDLKRGFNPLELELQTLNRVTGIKMGDI